MQWLQIVIKCFKPIFFPDTIAKNYHTLSVTMLSPDSCYAETDVNLPVVMTTDVLDSDWMKAELSGNTDVQFNIRRKGRLNEGCLDLRLALLILWDLRLTFSYSSRFEIVKPLRNCDQEILWDYKIGIILWDILHFLILASLSPFPLNNFSHG